MQGGRLHVSTGSLRNVRATVETVAAWVSATTAMLLCVEDGFKGLYGIGTRPPGPGLIGGFALCGLWLLFAFLGRTNVRSGSLSSDVKPDARTP